MIQVIPAFFALVVAGGLVVPPAPAVQAPDAAGTWDVVFNTPNGARKGKLVLKRDGETLTGVAVAENAAEYNIEGQQKGADVSMRFTYTADTSIPITMKGTVKGDTMSGTATFGSDPGDWTATRVGSGRRTGCRHAGGARHQRGVGVRGHDGRGFGVPGGDLQAEWRDADRPVLGQLGEAPIQGTLKGNELTFSFDVSVQDTKMHIVYPGTAAKDALKGTVTLGELGEGTFTARRK